MIEKTSKIILIQSFMNAAELTNSCGNGEFFLERCLESSLRFDVDFFS